MFPQIPFHQIFLSEELFGLELSRLQKSDEVEELNQVVLKGGCREKEDKSLLNLVDEFPCQGCPVPQVMRLVHHYKVIKTLSYYGHVLFTLCQIEGCNNIFPVPEPFRVVRRFYVVGRHEFNAEFCLHLLFPLRNEGRRSQNQNI